MVAPTADRRAHLAGLVVALACALCVGLTFRRLLFGVDFLDESWYLACSYRYLLGDRPFVDELNPSQAAFLITAPLLHIYVWSTGGVEGAILYMRVLYLAFCCGLAACAWRCFRSHVGDARALLASAICVAFVPFGLPSLSYNTLAGGFFSAGMFLGVAAKDGRRRDLGMFAAGLAHALAAIAIPTYLVASLAFACLLLSRRATGTRLRGILSYACGGSIPLLLLAPSLLGLNAEFLEAAYRHAEGGSGWPAKLSRIPRVFWRGLPHKEWLGVVLILAALGRWRGMRWPVLVALCALPLLLAADRESTSSAFYVVYLASSAPLLTVLLREDRRVRELLTLLWLPSLLCGVSAACTSATGLANAAFGLLPGAVLSAILATRAIREFSRQSGPGLLAALSLVWLLVPVVALIRFQQYPFRDLRLSMLDSVIDEGPFRGLHTTAARRDLWQQVSADVERFAAPGRRILFYPLFPAGYVASAMRPAGRTAWSLWPRGVTEAEIEATLSSALDPHREQGVVIFEMRTFPSPTAYPEIQRLPPGGILPSGARLELERPEYAVFLFP